MPDKEWYKSKTIWGAIIGFLAFASSYIFGTSVITSEEGTLLADTLVKLSEAVVAVIGLLLVIIGRVRAGKEVKQLRRKLSARP